MNNRNSERTQVFEPILVGGIVAVVYYIQSLSSLMAVGAFNDDGVYAVLGQAIAEGRGYVSLHLAGAPIHPKFPPVFPLILAACWKLTGSIEGVQRIVNMLHPIVCNTSTHTFWRSYTRKLWMS